MISHLNEWIGKTLLLMGWTLIRIKSIIEVLKEMKKTGTKKELESSPVKLKKEFR